MARIWRRLLAFLMLVSIAGVLVAREAPLVRLSPIVLSAISTAAVVYGIRVFRPTGSIRSLFLSLEPWGFIALGVILSTASALPLLSEHFHSRHDDLAVISAYALASITNCVGLALIVRDRFGQRQMRERFGETALMTVTACYVLWLIFEITAGMQSTAMQTMSGMSPDTTAEAMRLLIMAIPDVLAVVLIGQILTSYPEKPTAYKMVLLATVARATGTVGLMALGHRLVSHTVLDYIASILYVGLIGCAALHPSMTRHDELLQYSPERGTQWRFSLVTGALIFGPIASGILVTTGVPLRGITLMIGTTFIPLVIVIHLLSLIRLGSQSEHEAKHDDLTGLPNRSLLHARIETAIATANKTGTMAALLFIDLDRFKTINDSLGHAAGNQLLQQVAQRLLQCVEASHTVSRLGGDEFAVLVTPISDQRQATEIAERIIASFQVPIALTRRNHVFVTPSIGIAITDSESHTTDSLLANADTAMYQAKEHGRNRFETFVPSMNEHAQRRLGLESALRGAIDRDEFTLHYQPKVDLLTGDIKGVEALVRWRHPELGLLSPIEFVGIAEETGFIEQLGEWVLNKACSQARAWYDLGFTSLTVAVNISPRQFQATNVADRVAAALRSVRLDPAQLEIEITEGIAFFGEDRAIEFLHEIKQLGVSISIDDFGTGYSSLSYLARFPVDRVKIDKSFVDQISRQHGDAPLVTAMIAMAHSLNLEVIAEGVERRDQIEFLQAYGCDQIQGYLFSRPLPAEEFETLMMLEHVAGGEGRLSLSRDPRFSERRPSENSEPPANVSSHDDSESQVSGRHFRN